MKKIAMIVLMTAVMAVVAAPKAEAAAITGGISFAGTATPCQTLGVSGCATAAPWFGSASTKAIHFVNPVTVASSVSGDYAGTAGSSVTFTDFVFDPFNVNVTPLWTFTYNSKVYSFDLTSVTTVNRLEVLIPGVCATTPCVSTLTVAGMGTLSIDGYDPTPGTFIFTGQDANGATFSFSASDAAMPVPEPGTMVLFGTGLLGIAAAARRMRKA